MIFVQPLCDNFLFDTYIILLFSLFFFLSIVFDQWKEREKKLLQKLYQMVV